MVSVRADGTVSPRRHTLNNIQVLRFVAAAAVLTKHIIDLFVPLTSPIFRVPWSAGVDLFFVVSGFIMALIAKGSFGAQGAARGFLLRRAIRIVPAYWFFTSVMVAMLLIAPNLAHHTILTAPQLITSYAFMAWPRPSDGTLTPLLSQGWTLNYEAFFYVCFAVALLTRKGLNWLILSFVLLVAANGLFAEKSSIASFYSDPLILEFVAGIFLHRCYAAGWRMPLWGSVTCLFAAVLGYALAPALPEMLWSRFTILGLPSAILAAAFIFAPEPDDRHPLVRALVAGGDASYTLYLSHPFIVNAVFLCTASYLPKVAGMALSAAAAVGFAFLFYRAVERPVTAWLYRTAEQRRPPEAQLVAP